MAGRLKLSNRQAWRLSVLAAPPADIGPDADAPSVTRTLRRLGPDTVRDLTLLAWAGELSITPHLPAGRTQAWIGLLDTCDGWQGVVLPIGGEDVIALGVAEGPRVGELLARVEDWWEDGDYPAGRADGPVDWSDPNTITPPASTIAWKK